MYCAKNLGPNGDTGNMYLTFLYFSHMQKKILHMFVLRILVQ